jgi:transcriptional regulator with XRE-family HTH domain
MEQSREFAERKKQYETDPDYILHGLLYDIAEDIYAAMEEQGLTQAELSERIGAHRQFVNRFLNTPHNTTLRTVVRLATALGLEFTYELKPRAGGDGEADTPKGAELEPASAGDST